MVRRPGPPGARRDERVLAPGCPAPPRPRARPGGPRGPPAADPRSGRRAPPGTDPNRPTFLHDWEEVAAVATSTSPRAGLLALVVVDPRRFSWMVRHRGTPLIDDP